MAGLSDILTAIQNGVTALNNLGSQVRGSFNNISSQLTQPHALVTFTRVLSVASGDTAITGVGFKPRAIFFMTGIATSGTWCSFGHAVPGNNNCSELALNSGGIISEQMQVGTGGIQRDNAAGTNYQTFFLASMDPDGFTLTWTKNGVPTAICTVSALCFR